MVASNTNLLGVGIYTPAEAAYYARVPTQTMTRWVHGDRRGDPVVHAQLEGTQERVVTFLDFVQALAVRAIRREFKIPLGKIREAVEQARTRYSVDYPFAMPHKTFLFDHDIHIELLRLTLVQVSGKQKGQMVAREIAEPYMVDLTYADDLACRYYAYSYGTRQVIIDPARRFGQPFVEPCRCSVQSLLGAYRSEGSPEAAAKAYGVEEDDVLFAIRYEDHLQGTAAA